IALVAAHSDDPCAVNCSAEIKRLATRLAVSANKWVHDAAPLAIVLALRGRFSQPQLTRFVIDVLEEDLPSIDGCFQCRRQCFVGKIGRQEGGLTACGRDLDSTTNGI